MHRLVRRSVSLVALVCFGTGLAVAGTGCGGSKVVPSSGPRAATTASQVKLFQKAPKKYELLGTVRVTSAEGAKWDERGNADAAFDKFKTRAAAMGANGVLFNAAPGEFDRRATAGYHGTFYQVPILGKPPTGVAQAIYVLEE